LSIPKGRGYTHAYLYQEEDPTGPLRSHKQTVNHAKQALSSGSPVYGVKGPSWLSQVPGFNLVRGMSVDYMHLVLLGVSRLLLRLWFDSKHHKELWYIGPRLHHVDERLCAIRVPDEFKRTPRSLEGTLKFWKAHELRSWLLHYSPAVLLDILPDAYYQHHLVLVNAVYLLLKDEVCDSDVKESSQLLQYYCFLFAPLCGKCLFLYIHMC